MSLVCFVRVVVDAVQSAVAKNEFEIAIRGIRAIYYLNHNDRVNATELEEVEARQGACGWWLVRGFLADF